MVRRELWQKSPDVVRAFVRASREGELGSLKSAPRADDYLIKIE
jgi:hypothetical protein